VDAEKFKAARAKLGWSQERLAKEAEVSQSTIDKIEQGTTRNSRFLPRIARALGIPLHQLDPEAADEMTSKEKAGGVTGIKHREGWPPQPDVPLFAAVEGGPGEIVMSNEPISFISCPDPLIGVRDGYAVIITGESMTPEYRPADVALVHPWLPPTPDATFIFQNDNPADPRASIKHLVKFTMDTWTVEQWNPPKRFTLKRSAWPTAHRVVGKYSRR